MSTYICKKCGNPADLATDDAHIYGSDETFMSLEWCPSCPGVQNRQGDDYSGGASKDGNNDDEAEWGDDDGGGAYDDDDGGSSSGGASGGGRW